MDKQAPLCVQEARILDLEVELQVRLARVRNVRKVSRLVSLYRLNEIDLQNGLADLAERIVEDNRVGKETRDGRA